MKKNNETPTLEQLLQSVEHAGRDHRRQQQLAQMIDHLAAAEQSRRRTIRLWATGFAVAATITLFVVVPVWKWIEPLQPAVPQLAQAPVLRRAPLPVSQPVQPMASHPASRPQSQPSTARPVAQPVSSPIVPDQQPASEVVPEYQSVEPIQSVESRFDDIALAEPLPDNVDTTLAIPSAGPVASPAQPSQVAQAPVQTRRQSFFSFLNAEPSLMDGTMLAFNIL